MQGLKDVSWVLLRVPGLRLSCGCAFFVEGGLHGLCVPRLWSLYCVERLAPRAWGFQEVQGP